MDIKISEIGSDGDPHALHHLCDLHNETDLQMLQQANYLVSFTHILAIKLCFTTGCLTVRQDPMDFPWDFGMGRTVGL